MVRRYRDFRHARGRATSRQVVIEFAVDEMRAEVSRRQADGSLVNNRRRSAQLDVVGVDISAGVRGRRTQPKQRRTPILRPDTGNRGDKRRRGYLERRTVRRRRFVGGTADGSRGRSDRLGRRVTRNSGHQQGEAQADSKKLHQQISKMRPAEYCEDATSWDSCTHMAGADCSRISHGRGITPYSPDN